MFKIYVVPDIHGDINSFLLPLQEFIKNFKKEHYLIYLGDYIDRGEFGLTILRMIKYIKDSDNKYKNNIIFLLGNHDAFAQYTTIEQDRTHTADIVQILYEMNGIYEPEDKTISSKYFDILVKIPFKDSFITFSHDDLYIKHSPIEINNINDILFKYNSLDNDFNTLTEYDYYGRGLSIHAHTHGGNIRKIIRQLHRFYISDEINQSIDLDINQSYWYNNNSTNSLFIILSNNSFEIHNCYNIDNKYYKATYKSDVKRMFYYSGEYDSKNNYSFDYSKCLDMKENIIKTIHESNGKTYKDTSFFNKDCYYYKNPFLIIPIEPNYSDFIEEPQEGKIYKLFNDYKEEIKEYENNNYNKDKNEDKNENNRTEFKKTNDFLDYSIILIIVCIIIGIIADFIISNKEIEIIEKERKEIITRYY